eukprot:TRINITY_DN1747_c0_g1_i1.p1 TRINITY_DN1747_c0_g1~~TRINITY_DN1747_c0_g1_i1.p1  ORF type:complete len:549 (-),score=70.11 TRINITY_DN1747_c0_g1_i1:68-1690(-)
MLEPYIAATRLCFVFGFLHFIWLVVRIQRQRRRFLRLTEKIPIVGESHWFWGTSHHFLRNVNRLHDWRMEAHLQQTTDLATIRQIPPLFRGHGVITTRDPKMVQLMLKDDFDLWVKTQAEMKTPGLDLFGDWMGDGIFNVDHGPHSRDKGWAWQTQRKIAANIFTRHNFREHMLGVFQEHGHELCSVLKERVHSGSPVDLQDVFFRFTMDAFATVGFGVEMHTLRDVHDPYAASFDRVHQLALELISKRFVVLFLVRLIPWPLQRLAIALLRCLDPLLREFDRHIAIINRYSYSIIEERQRRLEASTKDSPDGIPEIGQDILSLFIHASHKDGTKLSRRFLRDVVMSFFIAGRDTTAVTLSWTFYVLCQNPGVAQKLVEEIDRELAGAEPTYENLKPLKYLNGVIHEVLRLYPPVPGDFKVAAKDAKLPDGTIIPEGTTGIYLPYVMGRSRELWPEPLEVKPERWFNQQPSQFEFPVFQAGPRICLGMNMALLEAKVVVVMVLQRFKFDLVPNQEIHYARMLTMSIKNGLQVLVQNRSPQ